MTGPLDDAALKIQPRALLLDFGGVLFQTHKPAEGRESMARWIEELLERSGQPVPGELVRTSLGAGLTALKHWKHASSRRLEPREMGHREIVRDFVAADYPPAARAVLVAEAGEVLAAMTRILSTHTIRPGVPELLALARERDMGVAIVSNAHSGRSHRALLAEHGLDGWIDVQVYSDEVGIRKPHPRMIELAAAALGVAPAQAWYVGDTQDRDVVAGRRAGVGAVVVTRAQHTDSPPFPVADRADVTLDSPAGLVDLLRAASPAPAPRSIPAASGRPALLIDHGGVISTAVKDPAPVQEFTAHLARLLDLETGEASALVASARAGQVRFKADGSGVEVTPRQFWLDFAGGALDLRRRAVLEAEADDLLHRYARAKSVRTLRPGVRALLQHAREHEVPVVVVSNTLSGRVVREEVARHGLAPLVGAYVASDETGHRKPDRRILDEAILLAGADPARSLFLGDKPHTDAAVARAVGVAQRVLVRGGSTDEAGLQQALADGLATAVVDDASGAIDLLAPEGDPVANPALVRA